MRLQEPDFPPEVHPTVRDFAGDVVTLHRTGGFEPPLAASAPESSEQPDAQTLFRVVAEAGTGNVYLYIWNKTTGTWRGLQFTLAPA